MKKLILIMALATGAVCLTGCDGDYMESNRCVANRCVAWDQNHTFTKATVMYGNTNAVYDVVAWRDYHRDEVRLWVKDESSPRGLKVLLTHYSRVILENPNPKCDPKF